MSADGRGLVSQAGAVLLWETMRVTGLGRGLSQDLARWRAPRAVHDPGKVIADLAAAVALGGDCLADIAVLREQPELAGPVASDPVVSRLVSELAADLPRALKAIRSARAAARERAWALAGDTAPGADGGLVTVDLDATIVIAHSEKRTAAPTWKKTFGFHPLTAWADHGAGGNGEPLGHRAARRERRVEHRRRPHRGHPAVAGAAAAPPAAQGPGPRRLRRRHPRVPGMADRQVPAAALLSRHDDHRGHAGRDPESPRDGLDAGLRRGRAGPGRRLGRGHHRAAGPVRPGRPGCGSSSARSARTPGRSCGSPTSTGTGSPPSPPTRSKGQLADLELRHRRRARCEDRIRCAKDTGLRNLPLKGFAQNQLWCEIVALACELLAWTQLLALTGTARRWEPKRLRLRLFSVAGRLVRGGRRLRLRLAERWPWAGEITAAVTRLQALPSG